MLIRTAFHIFSVILVFVLLAAIAQEVRAQTLTTLYTFTGWADGYAPQSNLVFDAQGNLYGTTKFGGVVLPCPAGGHGACGNNVPLGEGTVFKVTPNGGEAVLHRFHFLQIHGVASPPTTYSNDGAFPEAGLVFDAQGNLYGTTLLGGDYDSGVVFKLTPNGTETLLYTFTGGADGGRPDVGLVFDAQGNLYGTTYQGGAYGGGTAFKLTPSGTETVLYNFTGGADGWGPMGALLLDGQGNLYGTTYEGGGSCTGGPCGAVFEVAPNGAETTLHTFTGYPNDGASPAAGLAFDAQGNIYGTTVFGGAYQCSGYAAGCGTVFKISPNGTETVLYNFDEGCGAYPFSNIVFDAQGNLYGTTSAGGADDDGTIFELTPGGAETVPYSFTGAADGAAPGAGLVFDAQGNLYGTTGGSPIFYNYNPGTVFKFTP